MPVVIIACITVHVETMYIVTVIMRAIMGLIWQAKPFSLPSCEGEGSSKGHF